jgi:hypothetical protein
MQVDEGTSTQQLSIQNRTSVFGHYKEPPKIGSRGCKNQSDMALKYDNKILYQKQSLLKPNRETTMQQMSELYPNLEYGSLKPCNHRSPDPQNDFTDTLFPKSHHSSTFNVTHSKN